MVISVWAESEKPVKVTAFELCTEGWGVLREEEGLWGRGDGIDDRVGAGWAVAACGGCMVGKVG